MDERTEKFRWISIILASILLAGMVGYAYVSAPEIRNLPYRNDNSQIASNSSRILGVSVNSFTVKWQHGQPKTFVVQSPLPFKVGDVVAFKLDIRGETVIIQEYHVWERLSLWYAKLFVSVVPLVVILVLFFKEFSLSWRKLIFLRKT